MKTAGEHTNGLLSLKFRRKDMDHFTSILDNTLKTLNSDYEAKRHKNLTLEFPHVVSAPQGTFYNWMKQRGKNRWTK